MTVELATERLVVSPLAEADLAAFVGYRQDPEVARYQSWETSYSLADASDLIAAQQGGRLPRPGHWLQLGVRDRASGDLLGDLALHRVDDQPDTFEIGVTLARSSQGRGIASEAVGALVRFVFEVANAHRVVAFCDARNTALVRLMARCGFRHESTAVEADWFKGEWTTLEGFALLAREFAAPSR